MRQCLKKSVNEDINELTQLSNDKSRQYDSFNSTKNVLKSIRLNLTNKVKENLTTQGLVMRHVWDCVLSKTKQCGRLYRRLCQGTSSTTQ